MKLLRVCLFFVMLGATAMADSAYQALRSLGTERGQGILQKVIEVKGVHGADQPVMWRVLLEDAQARGGVREFELSGARIVSERTPVREFAGSTEGSVMDFSKLNLDSSGAFTIAEKEAIRAKTGFETVDYLLSAGETKQPVWTLTLNDVNGHRTGLVQLAADTGAVLRRDFSVGTAVDVVTPGENPPPSEDEDGGGVIGTLDRFGRKVKKRLIRDGAHMEHFFTGKRTIDREYRDQ